MANVLVVSIKPEFATKIFNGEKSIELRKSAPKVNPGDTMVVYCTDPVKAVIGICEVKEVLKMKPAHLWKAHNSVLGIDKKRYEEYYSNVSTAVAIVIGAVARLDTQISLKTIKENLPSFQPPQTFAYYKKSLLFPALLPLETTKRATN
jgi:predicted transcriptional regulator